MWGRSAYRFSNPPKLGPVLPSLSRVATSIRSAMGTFDTTSGDLRVYMSLRQPACTACSLHSIFLYDHLRTCWPVGLVQWTRVGVFSMTP
jgi:hypothetical protein